MIILPGKRVGATIAHGPVHHHVATVLVVCGCSVPKELPLQRLTDVEAYFELAGVKLAFLTLALAVVVARGHR